MNNGRNHEERGQSLIIVAFLFLALIILAAIAADVTNAYYQRRTAQNAADAAALAAAQELGHQLRGEAVADADVLAMLDGFAGRNEVGKVKGNYLDEDETPIGEIGGGYIPDGAFGVEATAFLTAPTFFGGVVGMDGYPLDAEAAVQFGTVCYGGDCLLPISIFTGGFEDNPDYPTFDEQGTCYNLWDGAGGGNFGWLNWSSQGAQYSCMTYVDEDAPNDCSADCVDMNMDPTYCADQPDDMVMIGDYVAGTAGIKNAAAVRYWLDDYIDNNRIARFIVYDSTIDLGGPECGKTIWTDTGDLHKQQGTHYIVAGFAAFRITGYRLSQGVGQVVTRDEIDPTTCVDYPSSAGQCCMDWLQLEDGTFECSLWEECDHNTGEVNRITGVPVPWTEDAYDTCEGVGNFWAPRLTR
jgi:hypothetical protein